MEVLHGGSITIDGAFNQVQELAFTKDEQKKLECARTMPITFDEDCPETALKRTFRFRRVNPARRTATDR